MKKFEELGIRIPEILLPKTIDLKTWPVIACDQYTQDKEYWNEVEKNVANNPSTLNLILPEVYLNDSSKENRISQIHETMKKYISSNIFDSPKSEFIYIERKTAFNRTRKGLVALIDLDTYEWKPFSKANIRATEATIVERIPPRMKIRKGAPLELPHIMLLVDDKNDVLIGKIGESVKKSNPVYDGKLMSNGGSITGWAVSSEKDLSTLNQSLNIIADKNRQEDGSTFLFAVGDGNHSLATAKAVWDEYKKELQKNNVPENKINESPVKFALVEIVNIYDKGLTFEPIHRVIFNIDSYKLIKFISNKLNASIKETNSAKELKQLVEISTANFGFIFVQDNKTKFILLETNIKELAVSKLQPEIDEYIKTNTTSTKKIEIDYIHGADEVISLGEKQNSLGVLLPPIEKESFFETISTLGTLPRKSFSMGEADEKRFYLECRKLFSN
jgi:uncharacterized protein (DUF1015 family)